MLYSSLSFASFQEDLRTEFFKYASSHHPTFYLNSQSTFSSEQFLLGVNTYFESGTKGTWMVDPDPIRFDIYLDDEKKDLLWLGREHPLNLTRTDRVDPFSALGTIWSQNQMNALIPRVSGWIGAGGIKKLGDGWNINLAWSPLFLPNFSPSLGFSDFGDLNSSRFSRPPPAYVNTGGVNLPIRYKLEVGQLSKLLLQQQVFAGISKNSDSIGLDVYYYQAPRPNAVPLTNPYISSTTATGVNARVEIHPQFPREHWSGIRTQFNQILFKPAFEMVQGIHEWTEHFLSVTGYFDMPKINPHVARNSTRASFGMLTHFQKQYADPQFSDLMVFIKLPVDITDSLSYRNLIQQTLMNTKKSFYWLTELEYTISATFSVAAAMRILAGENYSYFGDWRQEDSISFGTRWVW